MNKIIKTLFFIAFSLAGLTSCETYGDVKIGETALGPVMSGEWVGAVVYNNDTNAELATEWTLKTYGTVDGDVSKAWIQIRYKLTNEANGAKVKVNCDKAALSFLPTETVSTVPPTGENTTAVGALPFKLIEGKVIKDGYTTLSGHKTDKLILIFQYGAPFFVTHNAPTARIEAWRETAWPEDHE